MGAALVGVGIRDGGLRVLILGIETATEQVSVAVGGHEGVIGLFEVTRGRRHAETLVPAIEFLLRQADIDIEEISVVPERIVVQVPPAQADQQERGQDHRLHPASAHPRRHLCA